MTTLWRVFLPLIPFVVIALLLSLVLRRWGYGWLPWALLGALIVLALVLSNQHLFRR